MKKLGELKTSGGANGFTARTYLPVIFSSLLFLIFQPLPSSAPHESHRKRRPDSPFSRSGIYRLASSAIGDSPPRCLRNPRACTAYPGDDDTAGAASSPLSPFGSIIVVVSVSRSVDESATSVTNYRDRISFVHRLPC
ncbi:hypothetical protein LZ31DRAFT_548122 [Colletotrichum somersetense]|nr:hypothetical protein LZ31DRAFT_548122 [Colletotrichum somersetense]